MTTWEYKSVPLERTGSKEDFSFNWTYGPWEMPSGQGTKQALLAGLQQLGREGWELAGMLPSDLWDEGGRSATSAHGVRSISCILLFKRPLETAP
jgi:hypothetical protein